MSLEVISVDIVLKLSALDRKVGYRALNKRGDGHDVNYYIHLLDVPASQSLVNIYLTTLKQRQGLQVLHPRLPSKGLPIVKR